MRRFAEQGRKEMKTRGASTENGHREIERDADAVPSSIPISLSSPARVQWQRATTLESRYATYSNTIPTVWQVGSSANGAVEWQELPLKRPLLLTSARARTRADRTRLRRKTALQSIASSTTSARSYGLPRRPPSSFSEPRLLPRHCHFLHVDFLILLTHPRAVGFSASKIHTPPSLGLRELDNLGFVIFVPNSLS